LSESATAHPVVSGNSEIGQKVWGITTPYYRLPGPGEVDTNPEQPIDWIISDDLPAAHSKESTKAQSGVVFSPRSPVIRDAEAACAISYAVKLIAAAIGDKTVGISIPWGETSINSNITTISHMYTYRGGDEVAKFLENNKFLTPLVSEAYNKLQAHFPHSTIFAEVVHGGLVISVGTTLDPENAIRKLDKFDEDWWLDACDRSQAKLCITVEYQ
jgi:hypothetical protein